MTSDAAPQPEPDVPADWEAFYRDYRKPGYIEGFEITSKLGGGMFGLVFRARRMSIGKDYAIKFLKVDDGEVRRAVLSELEQVKYFAQIDHPNLVSIEDRGEVHGIPYLVMAFAGTETLRDRMTQSSIGDGQPPTAAEKDELLRAFLQSCRGLQALHERSLVHFDIKPANVFLKGGVARLGDYGLSKLVTHSRGSLSMGRGTPYYMAPEMLQRRGDARSDVYSLGVMLYELLCGKVPFTGDSEWEVLRKHENAAPELPPHLTANERAVLQRCLAKDPLDRFDSVDAMMRALGAPTSAAAAAWGDVQAGAVAGDPAAPQPSAPGSSAGGPPPPPPSANEKSPYHEMAKASREAFRHAGEVARKAMRDANKSARDAAQKAQQAWRDGWGRTRHKGIRKLRVVNALHSSDLTRSERRRRQRVAAAIACPDDALPRSPSLLRGVAWTFGGLAIAAFVLATLWLGVVEPEMQARERPGVRARAVAYPAAAPQPARFSAAATFSAFDVPSRYESFVSTQEPQWARMRLRNRDQAKRMLLAQIVRLRAHAPISPKQRTAAELPGFTLAAGGTERDAIATELELLLGTRSYDKKLARRIAGRGPIALALAAQQMAELEFESRKDLERASRLQKLLVEATACRDLDLVTRGPLDELRAQNRALGQLWLWFVNEFGHTERSWNAYRQLLRL